jgi:flagellar motor switch/type III secretory pathway protein FliN
MSRHSYKGNGNSEFGQFMNDQRLADVELEISVVIGSTEMPIH